MKETHALQKAQKTTEAIETLRLLGIQVKSFTINFNELPGQLRRHDQNNRFKDSLAPLQKADMTSIP